LNGPQAARPRRGGRRHRARDRPDRRAGPGRRGARPPFPDGAR